MIQVRAPLERETDPRSSPHASPRYIGWERSLREDNFESAYQSSGPMCTSTLKAMPPTYSLIGKGGVKVYTGCRAFVCLRVYNNVYTRSGVLRSTLLGFIGF